MTSSQPEHSTTGVLSTPFSDLLHTRYSVRHFTNEPVTDEQLTAVLELAQRTPSWSNTQTWQVHVLGGEILTELGERLRAEVTKRTQRKLPAQILHCRSASRTKNSSAGERPAMAVTPRWALTETTTWLGSRRR